MQENCVNMSKGALNAGAKVAGSAFLGATLGMVFSGAPKDVYKSAATFAVLVAMWSAWDGVARIEKATELNADATNAGTSNSRTGWYAGGQTIGAFTSCALIAYLAKRNQIN